ncbi:exonuclease domain-containing protein [Bradyrhizobium ottawaense]|uniref:exonuclease domain-containing protein n=1 Tax=Bradyrhizobium ottawaense TaxID=931866 RepID=UPI003F49229E
MSFVFFDTETTGLKRGFDQILHFAAVRTDENLNEVARFETRSRLQPHVLPHPSALRTNGLPIESLTDSSLPSHYTMVGDIRRTLISWSPAVFRRLQLHPLRRGDAAPRPLPVPISGISDK